MFPMGFYPQSNLLPWSCSLSLPISIVTYQWLHTIYNKPHRAFEIHMLNNLLWSHSQYIEIRGHITLAIIEGAWQAMENVSISQHLEGEFIKCVIVTENIKAFSDHKFSCFTQSRLMSAYINHYYFIHQQFSHGADRGSTHIGNTDM